MNRLKNLRNDMKLSQQKLGNMFGKSDVAIAYYESEKRQMDYQTLFDFADYFGVSIDYLLGHKTKSAGVMVTNEEAELLEQYRELGPEDKMMIQGVLKGLIYAKEKNETQTSKIG